MKYPGIKLGPPQWEASNFCQVTSYIEWGFFLWYLSTFQGEFSNSTLKWAMPHPSQILIYLPLIIKISVLYKFCCGKSVIKWLYPYSTWNLHFCTVCSSVHLQHINSHPHHHTASELVCKCRLDSGTRLPYMSLLKETSYVEWIVNKVAVNMCLYIHSFIQ
jgi:hypothetical protein